MHTELNGRNTFFDIVQGNGNKEISKPKKKRRIDLKNIVQKKKKKKERTNKAARSNGNANKVDTFLQNYHRTLERKYPNRELAHYLIADSFSNDSFFESLVRNKWETWRKESDADIESLRRMLKVPFDDLDKDVPRHVEENIHFLHEEFSQLMKERQTTWWLKSKGESTDLDGMIGTRQCFYQMNTSHSGRRMHEYCRIVS